MGIENNAIKISLYDFEFKLIPSWIHTLQTKINDTNKLISLLRSKEWFLETFTHMNYIPDFNWDEFDIIRYKTNEENVILYTFPYPPRMPLAKYGAVIANNDGFSYYTLEKSEHTNFSATLFNGAELKSEESWVLGLTSPQGHVNFGEVSACAIPNEFLKVLYSHGKISQYIQRNTNGSNVKLDSIQQSEKYHTSNDGRIFRINDDGSFTNIGNVNNFTDETTGDPKSPQKINWIQLTAGLIGVFFGTILIYNSGGIFLVIFFYVIFGLIALFKFNKKRHGTHNKNQGWTLPRLILFVLSIIIFCLIKYFNNKQDHSARQEFNEDSNGIKYAGDIYVGDIYVGDIYVGDYGTVDSVYFIEDSISY